MFVPDLQGEQITRLLPKLFVGLSDHLVGPAEAIEVIDVERTKIDLERVGDIGFA